MSTYGCLPANPSRGWVGPGLRRDDGTCEGNEASFGWMGLGLHRYRYQKHDSNEQSGCAGSTLLEMLVVLIVMTAVIALAVPLMNGRAGARELEIKIEEIAAIMRHARTLAIRDNHEVGVAIDVKQRRVALAGVGEPVELPATAGLKVLTARGLIAGDNASIVFTPQSGSTGGSIELSDGKVTATI